MGSRNFRSASRPLASPFSLSFLMKNPSILTIFILFVLWHPVQVVRAQADSKTFVEKSARTCKGVPDSRIISTLENTQSVSDCQNHCRITAACWGYQYSNGKCILYSFIPRLKRVTDLQVYCGKISKDYFQPYVTFSESSERVTIPTPNVNWYQETEIDCPHLQDNLKDWNSASTWPNGVLPVAGQDVTIPNNTKVLMSTKQKGMLGYITIPESSELIIGGTENVRFKTKGIEVKGKLIAGSETCPINTKIKITLVGSRPSDVVTNRPEEKVKGISVTGTLSLHGKQYKKTWTRLARTAKAGDDYAILQQQVNWEQGQKVVIVTTAMHDSKVWHQNEVLKVEMVKNFKFDTENIGSIVYFKSPFQHNHIANTAYQAEVGLLSRNIKILGSKKDSEPEDADIVGQPSARWYWGGSITVPREDRNLLGYGGHIIMHNGGKAFVEGVELFRMGQTNVLGRYPIHFHILENECRDCYFRHSSVHKSFYRCVSIHGTHNMTITENVGYDVVGYCYYLEDGVEEDNTFSYNLGAHIHHLGTPAEGGGQETEIAEQSETLTLPADVTASAFYITNVHNNLIGNAASGGWAGFAFPSLKRAIGSHTDVLMEPAARTSLVIDGNTAHSTGWWWYHAAGFYFGGALYINDNGILVYNAGRDSSNGRRNPCSQSTCNEATGECGRWCPYNNREWVKMTNSKVFLIPGGGTNSWSGRMEVKYYEAHDLGLALEALEPGFWIDNMVVNCRTGEKLVLPGQSQTRSIKGDGFFWYDTGQEHIISNSLFRNCGYREGYDEYDNSATRGCSVNDLDNGCNEKSTVFGFLTHSDQFNPETMQGTKNITFENCGRRFRLANYLGDNTRSTVSGRLQNWLDVDGSASGQGVPTIIGSGQPEAGLWWHVEDTVVDDPHGPLKFINMQNGLHRSIGHLRIKFDESVHSRVGTDFCLNGGGECNALGYIKHFGEYFESDQGLPVTANPDIAGPTGGFGWLFTLNQGAPKTLKIDMPEISPDSPLVLGVPYPSGTSVTITANAAENCSVNAYYTCKEEYTAVASPDLVRNGGGNVYHMSNDGFLTVRIIQTASGFTGNPGWIIPDMNTAGKWNDGYAIDRFDREGVLLIKSPWSAYIEIVADCSTQDGEYSAYCTGIPTTNYPNVCSSGYEQVAYDKCCRTTDLNDCEFA